MTESMQRMLGRRALAGQHPETPEQIMEWLETTARAWNRAPTPFEWGGKRAARRERARQRRHGLGGSGACTRRPIRRRRTAVEKWLSACQLTHLFQMIEDGGAGFSGSMPIHMNGNHALLRTCQPADGRVLLAWDFDADRRFTKHISLYHLMNSAYQVEYRFIRPGSFVGMMTVLVEDASLLYTALRMKMVPEEAAFPHRYQDHGPFSHLRYPASDDSEPPFTAP